MPYHHKKRRGRKPYKKKRYTRYRRLALNQATISGIPKQRTIKMKYAQAISIQGLAGAIHENQFRANGMYDPFVTVGGHQPFGWDTWTTLYNNYVVLGSKITARLVWTGQYTPTMVGAYLSDGDGVSYSTWQSFMEAGKGTTRMLTPDTTRPTVVRSFFGAKKFFNLADVKDNVGRIGAGVLQDPNEQGRFHIWCQAQDYTTDTPIIKGTIEIEYTVTFSEPKDLAPS